MAQPRKPTSVLEFSGAFKKNPKRRRERRFEPIPDGPLGAPPAYLKGEVLKCWFRIVAVAPLNVICNCDEMIVEMVARLMVRIRDPNCSMSAYTALRVGLRELGLTPASRSLVVPAVFGAQPGAVFGFAEDGRPLTGNEFADV
jgi:phage terminase small subunit